MRPESTIGPHMKKISMLLLLSLSLIGCSTDMIVKQPYTYSSADNFSEQVIDHADVSKQGMSIFQAHLKQQMETLGLTRSDASTNKVVEITFTDYYMRHGAARTVLGPFSGSDQITTDVVIKDMTGQVVGQFVVVSENSTLQSAHSLIEDHAEKIAQYLKTGQQ